MSLPDNHSFLRHVGASKLLDNGKVDGSAFRREPKDVDGVSGNWPEHFGGLSLTEALVEIRKAFAAKQRTIGAASKFAVLAVGKTKAEVQANERRAIDFVHAAESLDPSHAVIVGYTSEDDIVADLIAQVVETLLPGRA